MRMPLFSAADVAQLRDLAISARMVASEGGEAWAVTRPSVGGVGVKTFTAQAAITALVFRSTLGAVAPNGAGTPVLADVWRMIVLAGAVQPGDVLTSSADATYRFSVASIESWYDYSRCELDRVR